MKHVAQENASMLDASILSLVTMPDSSANAVYLHAGMKRCAALTAQHRRQLVTATPTAAPQATILHMRPQSPSLQVVRRVLWPAELQAVAVVMQQAVQSSVAFRQMYRASAGT